MCILPSPIEQKQQQKTCAKNERIVCRLLHPTTATIVMHASKAFSPPQSLKNPLSLFIHSCFTATLCFYLSPCIVRLEFVQILLVKLDPKRIQLGFQLQLDLMHILYLNASTFMILHKMCRFYAKWRWMETHRLISTTWHFIFMSSSEKNA